MACSSSRNLLPEHRESDEKKLRKIAPCQRHPPVSLGQTISQHCEPKTASFLNIGGKEEQEEEKEEKCLIIYSHKIRRGPYVSEVDRAPLHGGLKGIPAVHGQGKVLEPKGDEYQTHTVDEAKEGVHEEHSRPKRRPQQQDETPQAGSPGLLIHRHPAKGRHEKVLSTREGASGSIKRPEWEK